MRTHPVVMVYTSVCEEDVPWLDSYLGEMGRTGLPFCMHLDRCSDETFWRVTQHSNCQAVTQQKNPRVEFNETHKQEPFTCCVTARADWAIGLDVDEVFAKDVPEKLHEVIARHPAADVIDFKWVNVWEHDDLLRIDGPFADGHRTNLYNLTGGRRWRFTNPITNGAKLFRDDKWVRDEAKAVARDLVVVHRGMKTLELREAHKTRWDRIYSVALRGDPNPYGFWCYACDTSIMPHLVPNPHL